MVALSGYLRVYVFWNCSTNWPVFAFVLPFTGQMVGWCYRVMHPKCLQDVIIELTTENRNQLLQDKQQDSLISMDNIHNPHQFFYNASIQRNVVSHIISHLVVLISNDKLWTKFYLKRKQCNWAESKFSCVFVPYLIYKFTTLVTQDALWWPVGIEEVNDSSTDIPCSFALSLSIRIHHWTLLYICTSNICHDRYIYCNPHIKHTSKGSKEAR